MSTLGPAEALIKANMSSEQRKDFSIVVAEAFHGFSEISGRSFPLDPSRDTGNCAAGACTIDVSRSAGDAWTQAGAGLLAPSLKTLLDPQDSGCQRVAGKSPSAAAPLGGSPVIDEPRCT